MVRRWLHSGVTQLVVDHIFLYDSDLNPIDALGSQKHVCRHNNHHVLIIIAFSLKGIVKNITPGSHPHDPVPMNELSAWHDYLEACHLDIEVTNLERPLRFNVSTVLTVDYPRELL